MIAALFLGGLLSLLWGLMQVWAHAMSSSSESQFEYTIYWVFGGVAVMLACVVAWILRWMG